MSKSGIVNVRMVITEEKILSNIAKVQRMIDPNSKKQIIQLEDDAYFKDLVESIKTYLIEYPKKKNFPKTVYKAAYGLVEFATNEFEDNTKQIEELIRQREKNIALAGDLKNVLNLVLNKDNSWKDAVKELLIGGANNTGIFTKVETLLESSLQSVTGYFSSADDTYQREISRLNDKIDKANADVEKYRARLEAKFASMDMLIAQMQQQYSTFLTT